MKYLMTIVSLFAAAPAAADTGFEGEVNLSHDKGAQGQGVLKWQAPVEGMIYRWGPLVAFGLTENSRLKDDQTLESQNYYSASLGISFVVKNSGSPIALFSDFGTGLDGIGLKTAKDENAKHLFFRLNSGFRFEDSSGTFVSLGVSLLNRDLSNSKLIRVNDARLTKYSLSPFFGFGSRF
jgi:hypothetical protein